MSFKPMVKVIGEAGFHGNAVRFVTKEEGAAYAEDLMMRWTRVEEWRVDESDDPVNYTFADGILTRLA